MSRLPTLLLLAVALFTGFVPLRRCHALDGGSGVVPLGHHEHVHRAHEANQPPHAHDPCGCDHHDSSPVTHEHCCVDTPFDAGLASDSEASVLPALLPALAWACPGDALEPSPVPTWARPEGPPDTLRSVRNTVLLR